MRQVLVNIGVSGGISVSFVATSLLTCAVEDVRLSQKEVVLVKLHFDKA